jgi:hypothetical protein
MISLKEVLIWDDILIRDGLAAALTWLRTKETGLSTYPRMFKLMRDRSDNSKARLGHVADGIEWQPGGQVTLRWKGPNVSVATFDTMSAMKAVHGYMNPVTLRYDTRVEYVKAPKELDRRLVEAIDELYYTLADYVDRVQKQAHVSRKELQAKFGKVQDLMVENAASVTFPIYTQNGCDTAECA